MNCNLERQATSEKWKMLRFKIGLTELIETQACSVNESEFSDVLLNVEGTQFEFKGNKAILSAERDKKC